MADPRCALTEMFTRDCAHCRQIPDPGLHAPTDTERQAMIHTGRWLPAMYPGRCAGCGDWFAVGAAIRRHDGGGWLAECCADEEAP